jgi:NTP pyrophosphatase (non-canonical NTP hydrolase)
MPGLTLNEYQFIAKKTAIYQDKIVYPALGLAGEAGEVAEKIKKLIRDKGGIVNLTNITTEDRDAVAKEIGDVLWYCAALSQDLGLKLEDIARMNIGKLLKRQEEGKISGSGDNR